MDVVTLIEQVLVKFLSSSGMPSWVQAIVMDLVKKYLTAEVVAKLEKEMACYVCAQVKAMASSTADNKIDDAIAAVVCKAIGGDVGCH